MHRSIQRGVIFYTALAAASLLVGCAQYSQIRERRPSYNPKPAGVGQLADAETNVLAALEAELSRPQQALDDYLNAAQTAERQLHRNLQDVAAKRDYNFAVGRIIEIIRDEKLTPWSKPLKVTGDRGEFELVAKPDPRPEWNPALFEFTPTDQFDVHGQYVTERTTREGVGAPIVAAEKQTVTEGRREQFAPSRIYRCETAVAHFEGQRCLLTFLDPLADETVTLDGRQFPLAADFTVPLAVMLQRTDPKKHELSRVLDPEKYAHTAAIERLQPYDPDKAIVLVIHGLMDSQATWTPMINKLRGDPDIRKHYQFWFYSYPSGYPYPYSAAILRHELDLLEKRYPARKPMVVIGHSMGGCISRLLLTDSGDKLWLNLFHKPPQEVKLSPHARQLFTDELIFRHRPEIGRVIFIAAPLRGSNLAASFIGRLSAWLIKAPRLHAATSRELAQSHEDIEDELKLSRHPNSVDTLAPNSGFVRAINTIPITPGVPYHTIIGDRGKGASPNSSDGVVPYWSSHMDGAESEKIVPSAHSAHQNPEAIQEVLRILKAHAR